MNQKKQEKFVETKQQKNQKDNLEKETKKTTNMYDILENPNLEISNTCIKGKKGKRQIS